MSDLGGIEAGPLYVDVVADTTGFARGLQEKINAQVRGIKANITADVDARKLEAQLAEIERKDRRTTLGVTVDDAKAKAQLDAVAAKTRQIELGVTVNAAKADAQLAAIAAKQRKVAIDVEVNDQTGEAKLAAIEAKRRVATIRADADVAVAEAKIAAAADKTRVSKIKADADVAAAEAKLAALTRNRKTKVEIVLDKVDDVGQSLQSFGTGALGLMQMPAIAAGISMAAGALAQLAAGLFSVAAAAAPAVGILAAIPGAVAGAAQGIGAVVVGFMGISAAIKASSQADAAAATQSSATSAQRAAAAQRIVAAQDRVKQSSIALQNAQANAAHSIQQAEQAAVQAHEQGAKAIAAAQQAVINVHQQGAQAIATAQKEVTTAVQTAARDTITAEKEVAQAQRDATQAQLDLIQARQLATRQLQDMNNNLTDAGFSVEEAQIGVQRADINRTKVDQNPKSTALDKEQADLDYREAVQRLKEQQLQQQRLQKDTAAANKAGVEGSSQVVAARQKVQDTTQKLIDAEKNLRQVRIDGASKVAQAEANLAKVRQDAAQKDAQAAAALTQARADAAQKDAQAEANLANTRRTSAYSVASAQHEVVLAQRDLADAQANATLQTNKQSTANTALAAAMAKLSPAGRAFVTFIRGTLMPAWQGLQKSVQEALVPPVQRGLTALLPLLGILQTGMVRTATILGGAFEDLSKHYLATPLFKRDLATIMSTNNRAFVTLGTTLIPLARALTDVTIAAGPLLQRFADFIAHSAEIVSNFIHVQRETGGLSRFFHLAGDTAGQLWRIVRDLVISIFNIGKAAYPAGKTLLDAFEGVVAKWRTWTESMKGQNALRDYFNNAVPMVKAVARLIHDAVIDFVGLGKDNSLAGLVDQIRTEALPAVKKLADNLKGAFGHSLIQAITDVIKTLTDLTTGGGGGALTGFVNTLDHIVRDIDTLIKMPGIGPVLGFLATMAGSIAAISLVLGPALRGLKLVIAALDAVIIRAGLAADGFSVLGVAMDIAMGPVGLILLALTAIGILFYELYQHSETFRNAMNALGREIKREWGILVDDLKAVGDFLAPAARAVGSFVGQVIGNIKTAFKQAPEAMRTLGADIVNGLVFGIGDAARGIGSWLNDHILQPIIGAVKSFFGIRSPSRVMMALGGDIIAGLVQGLLSGDPEAIIRGIATRIAGFFTNLGRSIRDWWNRDVSPIWASMRSAWNDTRDTIGGGVSRIKGFFSDLGRSIRDWWTRTVSTTWANVRNGWDSTRDNIGNGAARIKGFFTDLGNRIKDWWNRTVAPIWASMRNGWNSTRDNIANGVNRIKGFFSDLGSRISGVWNGPIKTAFNAIRTGLTSVQNAFRSGVDKIKGFWSLLKNAVVAPVRFVIDTIYNNGIRGFWNAIADKVKLPRLDPPLTIRGINASRGAVVPGYAPGVDIVPATLSPGEGILVPEAVRGLARNLGMSAEGAIQSINAAFSSRVSAPGGRAQSPRRGRGGLPAFDLGGILGGGAAWVGHQIGSGASAATSFVKDKVNGSLDALTNAVKGLLAGPLRAAAGPIHALINRVLPAHPALMNLLRKGSNNIVDQTIEKIIGRDESQNAPQGGGRLGGSFKFVGNIGSGVERWRQLVIKALSAQGLSTGLADRVLRQMATESGGNPNAVQGNIGDVNNRSGDLAKGFMQVIGATFRAFHWPGTSNNIFDPWANLMAALNYAKHQYGPSLSFLGQGHGYSLGGVAQSLLGKAGSLFDSGGILNPGTTLVQNATGQPEVVFTAPQWDTLSRIVTSAAASGPVIHEPSAAERLRGAQIDIHVHPQPGQDVREVAREVAVELGWLLR